MEIKGIFGVEIKDKEGNIIQEIRNDNTVTNLAIRQIKRWLDRKETLNIDAGQPVKFQDGFMCAGEMRRISIYEDYEIVRDDESTDDPSYPIQNAFDNNDETYFHFWNSADNWRHSFIRFKEPINLKGIGMMTHYGGDSYWHGAPVSTFGVKFDGCIVANAGTSAYNSGEYIRAITEYNNHEYYKQEDTEYYIFADATETKWQMSTSLGGTVDYETSTGALPEHPWTTTWSIVNGAALAPTITEGNTSFRKPYITRGDDLIDTDADSDGRHMEFFWRDHQMDDTDPESERYMGKYSYRIRTWESVEDLYDEAGRGKPQWYGYLPDVKEINIGMYSNSDSDYNHYVRRWDIFEAIPHPQNPYALKLGTDDGTILPLADTNTDLGAFSVGMEWKCDSITQTTGYTIRYSKALQPEEGNGVTFEEIGLFMNADGHLPNKMSSPDLDQADDLFARSFFDTPWSKTEDQTATIYYEITVN